MEKDDKDSVIQKFRDAIADKKVPEQVATVIEAGMRLDHELDD